VTEPADPSRPRILRWILGALGIALIGAGAFFARGSPHFTLLNAGLRVEYPWTHGAALLLAAAGVALLGGIAPSRFARIFLACLGLAVALASLDLWLYRLEAGPSSLTSRRLFPSTSLAWTEVSRVDSGRDALVVWGRGDDQIRIDTTGFRVDQREALERGIARRIREAGRGAVR
jgi:hypothetical protein